MLEKFAVDLPFGVSVDESKQKELLDANSVVAQAENVAIDKQGAFTVREGTQLMTNATIDPYDPTAGPSPDVAVGHTVHNYDNIGAVITDGEYLYDQSTSRSVWSRRDKISEVVVSRGPGVQPPGRSNTNKFDSLVANGVRITVFSVPRGHAAGDDNDAFNDGFSDVYYQLSDANSGAIFQGPKFLAQFYGPGYPDSLTLMCTSQHAVITGHTSTRDGAGVTLSNTIQAWVFDMLQPNKAPVVDVWYTNATGQQSCFVRCSGVDYDEYNSSTIIYAYNTPVNPGSRVFFREFDPATLTSVVADKTADVPGIISGVSMYQFQTIQRDQDANVVWVLWRNITTLNFQVRILNCNATFSNYSNLNTYSIAPVPINAINMVVSTCIGERDPVNGQFELWVSWSLGLMGGTAAGIHFRKMRYDAPTNNVQTRLFGNYRRLGVCTYSEPIKYGNRWYQWLCTVPYIGKTTGSGGVAYVRDWRSERNLFLCEIRGDDANGDQIRPVANIAPRLISQSNLPAYPHRCYMRPDIQETSMTIPIPVTRNGTSGSHIELCTASFENPFRTQSAQFGDTMSLSGGVAEFFDGDQVAEMNFLTAPSIELLDGPYPAVPDPSGKVIEPGTYSCFAVWEHTDARGNIHVSAPSNVVTRTFASNRQVWVNCHPIVVTSRMQASGYQSVRVVVYRTRKDESTFFRDMERVIGPADVIITQIFWQEDQNILFYTQPGVPGAANFHLPPPSLRCLIHHSGTLAGVAEDGRTIWFSGQHIPGEGAYFHNTYIAYIDDPSEITALASMDGRLYAFTTNTIWVLDGPGFADNGEGGYGPPTRLAVDSGCISERSVVVSPAGVLYQTQLGISLLTRSGEIIPFGRAVEDTLRDFPEITSAVLCNSIGEVRFTCNRYIGDPELEVARWLVWDYRNQAWFTATPSASVDIDGAKIQIAHSANIVDQSAPSSPSTWTVLYKNGRVVTSSPFSIVDQNYDYVNVPIPTSVTTGWIKTGGIQGFQRIWRLLFLYAIRQDQPTCRISIYHDYDESTPVEVRDFDFATLSAGREVEIHLKRQRCVSLRVKIEVLGPGALDYIGLRLICGVKNLNPQRASRRGTPST